MYKLVSLTALLFVLLCASPVWACMWDYDTLYQERQKFPEALELMTGKFPHHSEAFYRWRIRDREPRLERAKSRAETLRLLDDLAVAYDKVGEHDEAIRLMQDEALPLDPDRYETHANLGTFLIHAGKLELGTEHIREAIAINPNAHFGRERYQLYLVEWILGQEKLRGERRLPVGAPADQRMTEVSFGPEPAKTTPVQRHASFTNFLIHEKEVTDWDAARKAILGMMRFGDWRSPVLLEALGDITQRQSLSLLSYRAYLRAAQEAPSPKARERYEERADELWQKDFTRPPSEERDKVRGYLTRELEDARRWYEAVHANEKRWIENGENPEEKFVALYYSGEAPITPVVKSPDGWWQAQTNGGWPLLRMLAMLGGMACFALLVVLRRRRR